MLHLLTKDVADSKVNGAAGMLHIKKTRPNSEHIRNFTNKLCYMACIVNNMFLLNKFVFTDTYASELFYHANCLKRLGSDHIKESKVANEDNSQDCIKTLAFNKVLDQVVYLQVSFSM